MLLTATEQTQIEAEIAKLEAQVDVEVVVACNRCSSDYVAHRAWLSVGVSWLMSFVLAWAGMLPSIPLVLLTQLMVWSGLWALLHVPAVLRRLVGKTTMQAMVHKNAQYCFSAQGIYRTQRRCGMLLYVSLLERQVVILVDEGLRQTLPTAQLDTYVQWIGQGIAERRFAAALLRWLQHMPTQLPASRPGVTATNELSNAMVIQ